MGWSPIGVHVSAKSFAPRGRADRSIFPVRLRRPKVLFLFWGLWVVDVRPYFVYLRRFFFLFKVVSSRGFNVYEGLFHCFLQGNGFFFHGVAGRRRPLHPRRSNVSGWYLVLQYWRFMVTVGSGLIFVAGTGRFFMMQGSEVQVTSLLFYVSFEVIAICLGPQDSYNGADVYAIVPLRQHTHVITTSPLWVSRRFFVECPANFYRFFMDVRTFGVPMVLWLVGVDVARTGFFPLVGV